MAIHYSSVVHAGDQRVRYCSNEVRHDLSRQMLKAFRAAPSDAQRVANKQGGEAPDNRFAFCTTLVSQLSQFAIFELSCLVNSESISSE